MLIESVGIHCFRKTKGTYSLEVRKNIDRFLKLQNLCHAYFTVKKAS
jgi:hypothetical protein